MVGVTKLVEGKTQLSKLKRTGLASEDVVGGTSIADLTCGLACTTGQTNFSIGGDTKEAELSPPHQLVVGFLDASDAL